MIMRNHWLNRKNNPLNVKLIREAIEIEKKWSKTGLLDDVMKWRSIWPTAVLLQSERLCNEK